MYNCTALSEPDRWSGLLIRLTPFAPESTSPGMTTWNVDNTVSQRVSGTYALQFLVLWIISLFVSLVYCGWKYCSLVCCKRKTLLDDCWFRWLAQTNRVIIWCRSIQVLFSFCPKTFYPVTSNVWHIYRALNIDKKLIAQFAWKRKTNLLSSISLWLAIIATVTHMC
jgi:hypothetical protein